MTIREDCKRARREKERERGRRETERRGRDMERRERPLSLYIYMYGNMATYTYMLWSYYLVQVWPFWKLLSGPSLFFFSKTPIAKKHYKNWGFSPFFFWKNCAQTFWKLLSGPSWRFLRRSQLGPDNNFQLGPDNNFQKCHFFVIFCFENCAKMPILIVFLKNNQKMPKKLPKKR